MVTSPSLSTSSPISSSDISSSRPRPLMSFSASSLPIPKFSLRTDLYNLSKLSVFLVIMLFSISFPLFILSSLIFSSPSSDCNINSISFFFFSKDSLCSAVKSGFSNFETIESNAFLFPVAVSSESSSLLFLPQLQFSQSLQHVSFNAL